MLNKKVYLMYVKSSELELVWSYFTREEAERNSKQWGGHAAIHEVTIGTKTYLSGGQKQ